MPNGSSDLCPYSRYWHISWSQGDSDVMIGIQQAFLQKHTQGVSNPFSVFHLHALNLDQKLSDAKRQIQKNNAVTSHIMHTSSVFSLCYELKG